MDWVKGTKEACLAMKAGITMAIEQELSSFEGVTRCRAGLNDRKKKRRHIDPNLAPSGLTGLTSTITGRSL